MDNQHRSLDWLDDMAVVAGSVVKFVALEERMKTMDERYGKGWELLREDMAKRDVESAKRETRMLLSVAGLVSFVCRDPWHPDPLARLMSISFPS